MAKSIDECNREIKRWADKLSEANRASQEATRELDWWQDELKAAIDESKKKTN